MEAQALSLEEMEELKSLNRIHITWRDYALMLVNSTSNNGGLRDIWHEKIVSSYIHWTQGYGSISEVNLNGLEVLSELPSEFTESIVDDSYEHEGEFSWKKLGRLSGSKRMNVHIGKYPQESLSNEAYLCIRHILNNWEELGHLVLQSDLLRKMFKLAQMADGDCISQDEVLTYILERPVDDSRYGAWISAAVDVLRNGTPSNKFKKYWKTERVEGFPLNAKNWDECDKILSSIVFDPEDPNYSMEEMVQKLDHFFEVYECDLPLERQLENMDHMCKNIVLKEDVPWSPCWKKIAICVLKNDVSMKYAGFAPTYRERVARQQALAAFEIKQKEAKQMVQGVKQA